MRYLLLSAVALCIAGCGNFEWFPNNYGNIPTQNDIVLTPPTTVPVLTQVQSNTFLVTGLTNPVSISVVNGQYAINGAQNFTSVAGTVNNNDTVVVQHFSAAVLGASVTTTVTIGAKTGTFKSTTNTQNFTIPGKQATVNQLATSEPITVNFGDSTTVDRLIVQNITSTTPGKGEYSINGGTFTTNPGNVLTAGQTLTVRNTAGPTRGFQEVTTLTLLSGTVTLTGTFTSTAQ